MTHNPTKLALAALFEVYLRFLKGQEAQKPLWKRAIQITNGCLGEELGKLYCKAHFPESRRQMLLELVRNVKLVLGGPSLASTTQHVRREIAADLTSADQLKRDHRPNGEIRCPDHGRGCRAHLSLHDVAKLVPRKVFDEAFALRRRRIESAAFSKSNSQYEENLQAAEAKLNEQFQQQIDKINADLERRGEQRIAAMRIRVERD
eukprot:g6044.t1